MTSFYRRMKGALVKMSKSQTTPAKSIGSILGKRKLDFGCSTFFLSAPRPPLASPKLEKNSGVNRDGKNTNKREAKD